jgi:hypothetical protein
MNVDVSKEKIEEIVLESLEELYTKDIDLLEHDVSERAITHKFAEYLQKRIPHFHVDCEYNRNMDKPKSLYLLERSTEKLLKRELQKDKVNLENLSSVSTFPDVIVHRRRTNDSNLLVVELKKQNNRNNEEHDFKKLSAFTENTGYNSYKYKYGVFILLETGTMTPRRPELKWFINGTNDLQPPRHFTLTKPSRFIQRQQFNLTVTRLCLVRDAVHLEPHLF